MAGGGFYLILINDWLPMFTLIGRKTHLNLLHRHPVNRQGRKFIQSKIFTGIRLVVSLKLTADNFTEHKCLADAIGIERLVVSVSVMQGDQSHWRYIQSGFLLHFLHRIAGNALVHIHPAPPAGTTARFFSPGQAESCPPER